jgi:nitroreductase
MEYFFMLADLVLKNRSCRRFREDHPIRMETLKGLVNLGRLSASAANRQPLKYILSNDPQTNEKIFSCLAWAAYIKDWPGPAPGERPAAYFILLGDTSISEEFWCDHGIAGQSILLGACEKGIAGCFIGAINMPKLREELHIDEKYKIMLVIALGEPAEKIVIENIGSDGDIRYWRDRNGVHHVPKRSLDEIILNVYSNK